MTLGQKIEGERLSGYVSLLSDLGEQQVKFACVEVAKTWRYKAFPLPGDIRDMALRWTPPDQANPPAVFRESKPPDWKRLGGKVGFSPAEIEAMLEAGRQNRLAIYAKLEADPEWQATHGLRGRPGLPGSITMSTAPADPERRAPWAKDKAKAQGWTE